MTRKELWAARAALSTLEAPALQARGVALAITSRKEVLLACAVVCLFTLVFTLLWWNRYLGITNDGWHFFHAQQILAGNLPYKDFYLFIPPLHPLRVAAEISLFGNYLIVPQIFGLLERLVLFVVLCIWLCRFFPVPYATIGVVTGAALYLSDTSESLSSLHHEAVFWTTLAAFCCSTSLDRTRRKMLWSAAAGLFAGLAFSGKQTSGIGIAVAIPAFLLLTLKRDDWRSVLRLLASYAVGFVIPVGALIIWLASNDALSACVEQLFMQGPSSKGSLLKILLRPFNMLMEDLYLRRFALLAIFIVAVIAIAIRFNKRRATRFSSILSSSLFLTTRGAAIITAGAMLVLLAGVALSVSLVPPFNSFYLKAVREVPMLVAEIGMLVLFAAYFIRWWRAELTKAQWQMYAFVFTTFVVIATLSFSWVAFVSMLMPALPFLIALALSRLHQPFHRSSPWGFHWSLKGGLFVNTARLAVTVGCAVVVVLTVWCKLSTPYTWAAWREPSVHDATESSALPELSGLSLSPSTKELVERITRLIQQHSAETEPVFVHPHLPIFYTLAHRRPATFAAVHFFDVSPDYIARHDARFIVEQPPAVIVDFEFNEAQILDNEHLFRDGQLSGQRALMAAIHTLTANYELLASYEVPPRRNLIRVWSRKK